MTARPIVLLTLLLGGCAPAPLALPDGSPEEIERELIRLDSLWFAGYEARDRTLVDRVLAPTFTGNAAGVELDKAAALERVEANVWDRYAVDWMSVEVMGSVGLVRAHRTASRVDEGEVVTTRFAYLDVYRWEGGAWSCVSGQSSAIPAG